MDYSLGTIATPGDDPLVAVPDSGIDRKIVRATVVGRRITEARATVA